LWVTDRLHAPQGADACRATPIGVAANARFLHSEQQVTAAAQAAL